MIQAGIYRHYKGKLYLVLGTARHSETGEIMVVYVPLYEIPDNEGTQMAVRPLQMFTENVEITLRNKSKMTVPRFEYRPSGANENLQGGFVAGGRKWLGAAEHVMTNVPIDGCDCGDCKAARGLPTRGGHGPGYD